MASDVSGSTPNDTTYPAAVAWCAAVVFGVGAGGAAAMLQRYFAPVGVFPLAIGVIVGLATGGVWAGRGGGSKRAIVVSAALGGLLCVATLHVGSYLLAEREAAEEQRKVHEAMLKLVPEPGQAFDPVERKTGIQHYFTQQWYLGRPLGPQRIKGWALVGWWIGDLLLLMIGAVLAAAGVGKPRASRKSADAEAATATAGGDVRSGAGS